MSAWVSLATGDCLRVLDVLPALGRGIIGLLMVLAVVLVLLISALPAWLAVRGTRMTLTERTVSRTTGPWARALVVFQVAMTMVLVFTSGLIVRSLNTLLNADRGFDSQRLLSVRLSPNPRGLDNLDQTVYYPALVDRLAALPDVESVGFARYFGTVNVVLSPRPVAFLDSPDTTTGGVIEYISRVSSTRWACRSSRAATSAGATCRRVRAWLS